ncbi:hypothetical protein ACO0K9_10490 [Undibacterium sp. Ji50W]|uniref:hypothetical protein n=1 Tax=Undibacterium sp. Ji50W TaxID=3413041 RepID=UPI003BF23F1A
MLDEQELTTLLLSLLPSPAFLYGALIFGILGMAAYAYGRRKASTRIKWLAICLMFYPYLVGNETWALYLIGVALCGAIYFYHDKS